MSRGEWRNSRTVARAHRTRPCRTLHVRSPAWRRCRAWRTGARRRTRCGTRSAPPRATTRWRRSPSSCRRTSPACRRGARSPSVAGSPTSAFVTPFALAERLGRARAAGAGLAPITEPVLVAAIRVELRADAGFFGPVAEHAGHGVGARARRYAELSRARPATLDRIRREGSRARAGAGRAVRTGPAPASRVTSTRTRWCGHALDAVRRVRTGGGRDSVRSSSTCPQPLPPAFHDLVGAVTAARPTTWIVGLTGDASADAPVVDACSRWGVAVDGAPAAPVDRDRDDRRFRRRRRDPRRRRVGCWSSRPTACAWTAPRSSCRRSSRTPAPCDACSTAPASPTTARRSAGSPTPSPGARWPASSAWSTRRSRATTSSRILASAPIRRQDGRPVPVDRWDLISRRAGVVRRR